MSRKAIIFVPPHESSRQWRAQCIGYCTRHRHKLMAVVDTWTAVDRLVEQGIGDLVVVARIDHVPPEARPVVAVASDG